MNNMKVEIEFNNKPLTFLDGLQLLFIGLKLAEVIDWKWWIVFIPLYIELGCVAIIAAVRAWKERRIK